MCVCACVCLCVLRIKRTKHILNSRLQYLDFTISIATNQYLESPSQLLGSMNSGGGG
jgi:hypothetical protein